MEQERNEPPKEAGLLVPPGAPYIGCPGDKGCPHNTLYRYTIAELTTGVLSHYSLHQHGTILGTVHYVMVMCLSHRCLYLEYLVFVFWRVSSGSPCHQSYPPPEDKTD
jgi:hypothetical protein